MGFASSTPSYEERLGAIAEESAPGEYAAKSRQLTYNGISAPEARHRLVKTPSLEAKKAYCAKTRRSNYAASLRLEGYEVTESDAARELPSREAVLRAYRKRKQA